MCWTCGPKNLYSVLPVKSRALRAAAAGVSHWLYRRSDTLVAMSGALGEKAARHCRGARWPWCRSTVKTFYAQDVCDEALAARFAGRFCVVFAGNISPAQDLGLLVSCAKRLAAEGRRDIHFCIVGDGMSRGQLEADIRSAGVQEYFTFEGMQPVERIPAYHTMAGALFAALAKSDDLGLTVPAKITSYMAAGRPLLVAADGEAVRALCRAQAAGLPVRQAMNRRCTRTLCALRTCPPEGVRRWAGPGAAISGRISAAACFLQRLLACILGESAE